MRIHFVFYLGQLVLNCLKTIFQLSGIFFKLNPLSHEITGISHMVPDLFMGSGDTASGPPGCVAMSLVLINLS